MLHATHMTCWCAPAWRIIHLLTARHHLLKDIPLSRNWRLVKLLQILNTLHRFDGITKNAFYIKFACCKIWNL